MSAIRVVRPGILTTVQDRGRMGCGHLGVPQGGAVDPYALAWALRLAGLPEDAAVLEITLLGPSLEVLGTTGAALAGADLGASVNGERWPPGETRSLRAGDIVSFERPRQGLRAYLAFAGGVAADRVLGSASTDLQSGIGGFGGRALRTGDRLAVGGADLPMRRAPVPTMRSGDEVRIMAGPRDALFPDGALERLVCAPYDVTPQIDRVGMRLRGARIDGAPGSILSEGVPIGGIEVPPGGDPIVLLQGRGTVGGYPVLATVISADLPVLAQRKPGEKVRFVPVDRAQAVEAIRTQRVELAMPLAEIGKE